MTGFLLKSKQIMTVSCLPLHSLHAPPVGLSGAMDADAEPKSEPKSDAYPEMTTEELQAAEKAERAAAEKEKAEKRRRDFERSLAGPSVGKAGLMRDQTGVFSGRILV